MKTWQAELLVVLMVLSLTVIYTGGAWVEWLGAAAVLAGFAHAQVSDRLAEGAKLNEAIARQAEKWEWAAAEARTHNVHCWRWSLRYFVTKEALWLVYFVAHRSWSALAGVAVFLAYPVWRRWYRRAR